MTQLEKIAELGREFRNNPEVVHRVHVGQCITYMRFAIDHARDLAKCGQKDEARYWYRFLLNSKVLDILQHDGACEDLSRMCTDLSRLGGECHPADAADFTTDLEAIRSQLQDIRGLTEELLRRAGGPALGVVNGNA